MYEGLVSGDDFFDHAAFHVGQPEIAPAVTVGQLFVVQAE